MSSSNLYAGIDLGTTNSAVSVVNIDSNRKITTPVLDISRPIKMNSRGKITQDKRSLLPSCVAYYEDKDEASGYGVFVGDYAQEIARTKPYLVATSIKSQMGNDTVIYPDWSNDYPDKTPEAISAQILRTIKAALFDVIDEDVADAVITVPANFNTAQKEATLRAAELAGFIVRKSSGEYKDNILLSEPEAVIYDMINQVQQGNIPTEAIGLDFAQPKKVLVFDIGGGTLDVTLHEISRDKDVHDLFDISPLAISRYSSIAGDTFDTKVAEFMLEKYIEELTQEYGSEVKTRILNNKDSNMRALLPIAEEIKVKISTKYVEFKKRNKPMSQDQEFDYGGEMPQGYSCEDFLYLEDFENALTPLLGKQYSYQDYLKADTITDDKNIIYPILNVLGKAAKKLNTQDVQVDAVILNGGMSRLYLIEERLKDFFGFSPIKVGDPDKSVARGASVFHYYTSQNESKLAKKYDVFRTDVDDKESNVEKKVSNFVNLDADLPTANIVTTRNIVNDHLYIGLKGGAVKCLIEAGEELPYQSETMAFSISPNQEHLLIPIKEATLNPSEYKTIATGKISFNKKHRTEVPVYIKFKLGHGGAMSVTAWIDEDVHGTVDLILGNKMIKQSSPAKAMLPPEGANLIVANEMSSFKQLLRTIETPPKKPIQHKQQVQAKAKLKILKKSITQCGNPQDFAESILETLENATSTVALHLIPIARKLSPHWQQDEVNRLLSICFDKLKREFSGGWTMGESVSIINESIITIGSCGSQKDSERLMNDNLMKNPKYRNALLHAFGNSCTNTSWVVNEFRSDIANRRKVQESLKALTIAVHKQPHILCDSASLVEDLVTSIHGLVKDPRCNDSVLNIALVSLGTFCYTQPLMPNTQNEIQRTIENLSTFQSMRSEKNYIKALSLALSLINNEELSQEDEEYLLNLLTED